jgi:colicin import membrane protein
MKNTVLAILLGLAALPLWAQTAATTANADLDAERARLSDERKAVEARYATEQAACYKKFAVEGCLEDSRHRRRADTDDIKRQEAAINDFERKRRGAAELDKLEQQKSTQQSQDAEAKREQSLESQKDREQRAAEHAASRAQTTSEEAEQKRQFESKQRAHAEDLAKAANLKVQAPTERAEYEAKLKKAEEHRADLERQNAARTKPRSAPLPDHGATSPAPAVPASP